MTHTTTPWTKGRYLIHKLVALSLMGLLLYCYHSAGSADSTTDSTIPPKLLSSELDPDNLGTVGVAHVTGVINRTNRRYFERAVQQTKEQKLNTLIVHIDTDGGEVFEARKMLRLALDQAKDGPKLIAFVDFRAISAGAMIAYGHDAIFINKTASIGDIGVIFISREGEMKYAPEKVETVVRTLLTQASETRGWSKGLLLKMTARNQTLYRVTHADERQQYIIEDDFPGFLAAHPKIDKDDNTQVINYRGKDRLLTLTGKEAVELGMATGLAETLDDLYNTLGIDKDDVIDLTPTAVEQLASQLVLFAPMLAGLALMFLIFELKTPGVGLWAGLAALLGGLFLLSQYMLDLASHFELVLLILGVVLIAIEAMTFIAGGLLALVGLIAIFAGLVLMFLPNEFEFDFTDQRFVDALSSAGISAAMSVAIMVIGIVFFIYKLPKSRLASKLAVNEEITATSDTASSGENRYLVGQVGVTIDHLRPAGMIQIDGRTYNATAEHAAFIDKGSSVRVIDIQFGEPVVRSETAAQIGVNE